MQHFERFFMLKIAVAICFISFNVYAIKPVTKVIGLEGDVLVKNSDGTITPAKTNMELNEGTYLRTSKGSKIDLEFFDKTVVTVGPNALFKIQSFTTEAPGILALVRGQIRSKVSKEYMDMDDKNKSKLFIRTKTAAMGVRGTEFDVEYDEKNEKTTLITFEGKVAFNKLERHERNRELNQHELDSILERKERLMVERGQTTMVDRRSSRPEKIRRLEEKTIEKIKEQPLNKIEEQTSVKKEMRKIENATDAEFKDDISLKPINSDKHVVDPKKDIKKELNKDDRFEPKRDIKRDNRIDQRKEDSTTPTKLPTDSPTGTIIKR